MKDQYKTIQERLKTFEEIYMSPGLDPYHDEVASQHYAELSQFFEESVHEILEERQKTLSRLLETALEGEILSANTLHKLRVIDIRFNHKSKDYPFNMSI